MAEAMSLALAPRELTLSLLALFAVVAVVLCTVGLYGVMSYAVTQRTREIGIRMALGANPSELLGLLMDRGWKMILTGAALGLLLALAAARLLRELLYGVGAADPLTFAAAAALLGAVGFVASYVPARRATQLDPVSALRSE